MFDFFAQVLANKDKDILLTYTVKDKDGRTFHSVDGLNIEVKVRYIIYL